MAAKSIAAPIEPKETYRVKATMITKKPRHTKAMIQLAINSTVTPVRAPFPPLNPKYTGQLCPITAPAPAAKRLTQVLASPGCAYTPSSKPTRQAMIPFNISPARTNAAANFPCTLSVLVSPAFVLPWLLMSLPYIFPTITDVLRLPNR